MTQLLISVTSVAEAQIALESGADILDLKDPAAGALGALKQSQIISILEYISLQPAKNRKPVSATIGDIPMNPELIFKSVNQLAGIKVGSIGIDFIKIGFFPAKDYQPILDMLKVIAARGVKLVAVLFAEYQYSELIIPTIQQADFNGVMLDTAHKNGLNVMYHKCEIYMNRIAKAVLESGLRFGIAGSLQLQDVVVIKNLNPTYMGFRGGVCENNHRTAMLNAEKITAIRQLL